MEIENYSRYRFYPDGSVYCKSFGDFLKGGTRTRSNREDYFYLQDDIEKKGRRITKSMIIKELILSKKIII